MKKVKINYNFLVFLSAYLRNIDLSLDRSRWGNWADMKQYYQDFIPPKLVADALQKQVNLPLHTDELNLERTAFKTSNIQKFIHSNFPLKTLQLADAKYGFMLLLKFDKFLHSDIDVYTINVEKLRVAIAQYYTNILKLRLTGPDFSKTQSVEHYLENIQTFKISEFKEHLTL